MPIIPYFGCAKDKELLHLRDFINYLEYHSDYREVIRSHLDFKLLAAQADIKRALELLKRN